MATPEAEFLHRLSQAQSAEESAQEQPERRETVQQSRTKDRLGFARRIDDAISGRDSTVDSLRAVMDSLNAELEALRTPHEVREQAFMERLAILHDQEPETYPDPNDVAFDQVDIRGDSVLRPIVIGSERRSANLSDIENNKTLQNLWFAVNEDFQSRLDERAKQLRLEIAGHQFRNFISSIPGRIGELDQAIREIDPTSGARETVRRETGEAADFLGGLLRAGLERGREGLGAARETLGQGATDLEFLLREFVINEIIGSGEGSQRPFRNPRARRAERFAGRDPDRR